MTRFGQNRIVKSAEGIQNSTGEGEETKSSLCFGDMFRIFLALIPYSVLLDSNGILSHASDCVNRFTMKISYAFIIFEMDGVIFAFCNQVVKFTVQSNHRHHSTGGILH